MATRTREIQEVGTMVNPVTRQMFIPRTSTREVRGSKRVAEYFYAAKMFCPVQFVHSKKSRATSKLALNGFIGYYTELQK